MESFFLTSTRAELARWAALTTDRLPDTPEHLVLTSASGYPVLHGSPLTGERSVLFAHLAHPAFHVDRSLTSEQLRKLLSRAHHVSDPSSYQEVLRPCLVPVRSFVVTRYGPSGVEEKYSFARLSDDIVGLAGFVECNPKENSGRPSFTLLSIDAPPILNPFFQRLPAIITPHDSRSWLEWYGCCFGAHLEKFASIPAISFKEWYTVPVGREPLPLSKPLTIVRVVTPA